MATRLGDPIAWLIVLGLAAGITNAVPFEQHAVPDGTVSMEAENFDDNAAQGDHTWVFVTSPAGFSGTGAMQALPNNGDPAALSTPLWTQWNIDLASVGGGLQAVKTLTVGVSGSGKGILYIDDIQLYRLAPAVGGA